MPKIKTRCPQCGQKYNIPAEHLGTEIECPQCLAGFLVQELKEVPPAPAPAPAPAPTPKPILTLIEDDEPVHSMPTEKPLEKKDSSGQEKAKVYWDKIKQLKHNPALLGALCCLIIAAGINFFSNFLFLLWGPLYLVVFILGIVAIVQQRVGKGIGFIIASILFPAFICTANILIVPMAMMGLSTKIAHAEKEARLAELTERDLLTPSSQETSRKSVSLRSSSVSSPVAEKPSIDQHRQEMINLAKNISRPSEKYILNMLQQVALAEKTKAVRNNSQDYCRIEILERQLYNNTDINQFQKEIELGLLTQVGQSVRPTARARQVNGTYEYSYVPDKVMRILPPSYDQKTDSIDCVVTYNVSLQGIPKYVLDNAHVLNRWAKWRQSGIYIYNLKLTDSNSITFFWSQSRREWMLKYDGAIYDYQPDFKFEAIDNEITFVPEVIDPAPQVAAVPVAQSHPPVNTLQSPTTPGVIVVPSSPDQPIRTIAQGNPATRTPRVYHQPWERLAVSSVPAVEKPYTVELERVIVLSSNKYQWRAKLKFTAASGRFLSRSPRIEEDLTIAGDTYSIVDIHGQAKAYPKSNFNGGEVVSLEDAFSKAIAGNKQNQGSYRSNSTNSIELTNKTTGEKKKIYEGQTVKFNDYKARLWNSETRQSTELSVGDKFTVEHNGETFEYKVNDIKREFTSLSANHSTTRGSIIIEDLKSGIKTTLRQKH